MFTRLKGIAALPAWAPTSFFFLWLAPNLALVFLFHCGNPGYILLSLPPLVLLISWLAARFLNNLAWTAAGLAAALLVGNFPYERFVRPDVTTLKFQLLRATPRIAGMVESAQRELETLIRSMPGGPEEKLLLSFCRRFEAPNIRTVTYDFAEVYWAQFEGPELRFFPPRDGNPSSKPPDSIRSVAFVCAAAELPSAIRERFPRLRKIAGTNLYSIWADPAGTPLEEGTLQMLSP